MVNPCLIFGYNSLHKIAGIIFLSRQELPRNIKPSPFLIISQHFASYASQVSLFTHNQGVYDLDIFISGGIFGTARPSIILKALSSPLKLGYLFFHCAIRRRLLPKGFHEVFMNFLERHSFLTEILDNCSDFKFLHFANVSHPPLLRSASHKQPSTITCFSHSQCLSIRSNDPLTKIFIQ